ncbi:GNAT family N-acetyltransferase [Photobacterium sp. DNB23_23_1]|uniref:GNAT family N-acetyltransferase n=1 Tax=Photobacterium pectinilyticum TaxID=2906793 RepID=A0ABT1N991_9GAMM|nr:GNAT family N-acetyltransferase [Photobacterium sp. ZSDE20]MCQ1061305.1 GNAT family N-acetyltransferase [Photobacterium sp. ZSDE20]MDD1829884.1 GNAT family N-acetyltransferase [Photobacterium sp. ZSDE20]
MSKLRFHPLETLRFPLINRFYKSYYPAGKAKKDEVIWIGENNKGIQACVRFKQFDQYQLLTGMLVHPALRSQGLGLALLDACHGQLTASPSYCFAFGYLEAFYQDSGFIIITDNELPEPLQSRINRYRQSGKTLTPMIYDQKSKLELSQA